MISLNCNGRLLSSDRPLVMGILNATPDSFYAQSRFQEADQVGGVAGEMADQGASIIDIGGMSTRPGAEIISSSEEIDRVLPVIEAVRAATDAVISCDTIYAATARAAIAAGAGMINDISAGRFDPELWDLLPELRVPYVLMHMPAASPAEMQQRTMTYGENMLLHIWDFLAARVVQLRDAGVHDIIIDPGFGFGKTVAQNYELLKNLHTFQHIGVPVLAGVSRKSMIWRPLGIKPETSLTATTALHLYALQQGAGILRVHDVKAAVETVHLFELLEAAPLAGE